MYIYRDLHGLMYISENLGATVVVPVAPVVTSLANGNTKTQSQILISNLVSVDWLFWKIFG